MRSPRLRWPFVVRTSRLIIRDWTPADYEAWARGFRERGPARDRFDEGPVPAKEISRAVFRKLTRWYAARAREDHIYKFGLFHKKTGTMIGWVDFNVHQRFAFDWANLGYGIHNAYHRQGYASEALKAIIPAARRHLKLHRLEAVIAPGNRPSIALCRSLGLEKEGLRKRFIRRPDGSWEDSVVYVSIAPTPPRKR